MEPDPLNFLLTAGPRALQKTAIGLDEVDLHARIKYFVDRDRASPPPAWAVVNNTLPTAAPAPAVPARSAAAQARLAAHIAADRQFRQARSK